MATDSKTAETAVDVDPESREASRLESEAREKGITSSTRQSNEEQEGGVQDAQDAVVGGEEADEDEDEPQPTATFPQRLMNILANEEHADVMAWLPHGKGFVIRDKKRFETEIMPLYFKRSKFTSFTRKLNRWNFQRVSRGSEAGAYYHDHFQRGNVRLCMQMACKSERPKLPLAERALASHFAPWSQDVLSQQLLTQQQQQAAVLAAAGLTSQTKLFHDQNTVAGRIRQLDQHLQQQQHMAALAGLAANANPVLAAQLAVLGAPVAPGFGVPRIPVPMAAAPGSNPSMFLPFAVGTGIQALQRQDNNKTAADNYIAMLMAQEKMNTQMAAAAPMVNSTNSDNKAMEDALRSTAQRTQMNLLQQAAQQQQPMDQQPRPLQGGESNLPDPGSPGDMDPNGPTGSRGNIKRASAA